MRPVDKGESPYEKIKKYQDALPYLEKKMVYIVPTVKCPSTMYQK